jgi:hypothetical protein
MNVEKIDCKAIELNQNHVEYCALVLVVLSIGVLLPES